MSNAVSDDEALSLRRFVFPALFVLALFVGFEVISKVPPLLHTPQAAGAEAAEKEAWREEAAAGDEAASGEDGLG